MTAKLEEVASEVLRDMKLHKFTQLRVTKHGTIYGYDKYRMSLPNNPKDYGRNTGGKDLVKKWEGIRSEMYGDIPGFKQYVANKRAANGDVPPEEPLEPLQPFVEQPPQPTEPAPQGPQEAPETDVAKVKHGGNKHGGKWTCPKCGKVLKAPGRHRALCERAARREVKEAQKVFKAAPVFDELRKVIDALEKQYTLATHERDVAVNKVTELRRHLG